jgi:hypothetical protein
MAVSAVRFSDDLSKLVFFTRDPLYGHGYRAIIPITQYTNAPAFKFPMIIDNELKIETIRVVNVVGRPGLENMRAPYQYKGYVGNRAVEPSP